MDMLTVTVADGRTVRITPRMMNAVETLVSLRKGGFASVRGYSPESGYSVRPVYNATFLSRFSVHNLYRRKIASLQTLSFEDIQVKGDKIVSLPVEEQVALFTKVKEKMIASMTKSLDGDRSDAHRTAHDTFYVSFGDGVRGHLQTTKEGKKTVLVLGEDGLPMVDGVLISMIEMDRKVVTDGVRKVVDHGEDKLMEKSIERSLNRKSVDLKTLSLKEDNFESLRMDGETFTPESIMERVRGSITMTTEDLTNILDTEDAKV